MQIRLVHVGERVGAVELRYSLEEAREHISHFEKLIAEAEADTRRPAVIQQIVNIPGARKRKSGTPTQLQAKQGAEPTRPSGRRVFRLWRHKER